MRSSSQSGFTLIEVAISVGIGTIILLGTMSVFALYKSMESKQTVRLQGRLLLAQTSADLLANPHRYPRYVMAGEDAGYVMCFDNRLGAVTFDGTNMVGHKKVSELEPASSTEQTRPRFCDSRYEVHLVPVLTDALPQIKIYTWNQDGTTVGLALTSN